MTITIQQEDGCTPFTENVRLENATTHIAANDRLATEAKVLLAYNEMDDELDGPAYWDGESIVMGQCPDGCVAVEIAE